MKGVLLLFGCQTLFLWNHKTRHDLPGLHPNPTHRRGAVDDVGHAQGSTELRDETQTELALRLFQRLHF